MKVSCLDNLVVERVKVKPITNIELERARKEFERSRIVSSTDDIKDGDIIILRSGLAMIIHDGKACVRYPGGRTGSTPIKTLFNSDLTAKTVTDDDIMKVYRINRNLEPPITDSIYFSFELYNLIDRIQQGNLIETTIQLMFERN